MSIRIGKYEFEGPYRDTASLEDRSGVYAILDQRENNRYGLLDVGESSNVKTRVETHDRKDCWERNKKGTIHYAVHYTPGLQQAGRMAIEQEIRDQYNPPCGER